MVYNVALLVFFWCKPGAGSSRHNCPGIWNRATAPEIKKSTAKKQNENSFKKDMVSVLGFVKVELILWQTSGELNLYVSSELPMCKKIAYAICWDKSGAHSDMSEV